MRAIFVLAVTALLAACAATTPPVSSTAATAAPLVGSRWVGASEAGTDAAHPPALEFVNADHVAGYTGCNLLSGQWHAEGDAVRIAHVVITKRACVGPEDQVERRVLAAINDKSLIVRQGDRLIATGASGARYEFTAAR